MAKKMARIENGVVVNVEWCADKTEESDSLKNIADRSVAIGDSFSNGKFYRNDAEILSVTEQLAICTEALAILFEGEDV